MNLTLMLLMTLIPQTSNVHQCLSYEPTVVTLTGHHHVRVLVSVNSIRDLGRK
jgi:hypothetical protein